jgi:3-hydroxyisobutyrate dehydrogenase/2-hydroxy-3-oxopropionate reductase
VVTIKAPAVLKRDFSSNFSVKWLEKDIALMLESAAELGVPMPLTALSQQLYRAAITRGYGEEDICGSIRVLEEMSGCEVAAAARTEAA